MNVQQQQIPQPQASLYSQLQYQQQNDIQVIQNGYTWDGLKWVATGSNLESGAQYSNYTFNQPAPTQTLPPGCDYERYKTSYEQAVLLRNLAAEPDISESNKNELLRQAQWAEYHSSLAYYGRTSGSQSEQSAPQLSAAANASFVSSPSPPKSTETAGHNEYPESLQRYVNRLTEGDKTESEREKAQDIVERVIANAVRNNTLWTTDWDKCVVSSINPTNDVAANRKDLLGVAEESKSQSAYFASSAKDRLISSAKSEKKRKMAMPDSESSNSRHSASTPFNVSSNQCDAKPNMLFKNDSYYGPVSPGPFVVKQSSLGVNVSATTKKKFQAKASTRTKNPKGSMLPVVATVLRTTNTSFDASLSKLDARANRFSDMKTQVDVKSCTKSVSKPKSIKMFAQYMGEDVIGGGKKLDYNDFERMTVKGTCQVLEKEYLRLTAPPQAAKVRPEEVLQQHMINLQNMWVRKERDYTWFCSQLKAIRQDLTVQRLNNDFSVEVYETHARIALEVADLNEFNQSQTQLKELYKVINEQKDEVVGRRGLRNVNEFIAYRLIYYVFLTLNKKYEGGSTDVMNILLSLTPNQIKDPCISYALKVREAVSTNNYHSFFRLLGSSAPRMSAYLLDFMVGPIRFSALRTLCKAYHPSLEVKFVLLELGFIIGDPREWNQGIEWLKSCGCVLYDDNSLWNVKDSTVSESALKVKRSLI